MAVKGNYKGIVNGEEVKIQIFSCYKKADYSSGLGIQGRKYINVVDGCISYNGAMYDNFYHAPLKNFSKTLKQLTKVDKI